MGVDSRPKVRQAATTRTFVVLVNGECAEGQVWEAAMPPPDSARRTWWRSSTRTASGSVIKLDRTQWAEKFTAGGQP